MIGTIKAIAATGVGASLIAFPLGWKAKATMIDAAHGRALEAAQVQHKADLAALERDLQENDETRRQLAAELEAARANVRTITREIIREVPARVQDSDEKCDRAISPDLARLYNRSIGLRVGDEAGSTESAGSDKVATGRSVDGVRLAGGYPNGQTD